MPRPRSCLAGEDCGQHESGGVFGGLSGGLGDHHGPQPWRVLGHDRTSDRYSSFLREGFARIPRCPPVTASRRAGPSWIFRLGMKRRLNK